MKLRQLRSLAEVARRGLNVAEAAEALHPSQPGVSKQIRALEDELGVRVFARHGKRLVSVTEPGKAVIAIAERMLADAQNMRRAGEEYANEKLGTLTIAATHTQARYALPKAVAAFKRRYPKVELKIHQGNPTQTPAAEGCAAHARENCAVPDRHLRLQLRQPLADAEGVRVSRPDAERGARRARCRRDQELRRARPGGRDPR